MILNAIIIILSLIAAFIFGHMFGYEEGWRHGDQSGKLDQHLYDRNVEQKRRFK